MPLLVFAESAVPPPDAAPTVQRIASSLPTDMILMCACVVIAIGVLGGIYLIYRWVSAIGGVVSKIVTMWHENKDAHVPHAELLKSPPVASALTGHVTEWSQTPAFRAAVVNVLQSSEAAEVWTVRAAQWVTTDGFSGPVAKIAEHKANGAAQGIGNQLSKDLRLAIDEAVAARFAMLDDKIDGLREAMKDLVKRVDASIDRHT